MESKKGKNSMESEAKKRWMKENTRMVTMKLHNKTDADILSWLEGKESIQGEIKRLIRIAMDVERNQEK